MMNDWKRKTGLCGLLPIQVYYEPIQFIYRLIVFETSDYKSIIKKLSINHVYCYVPLCIIILIYSFQE